MNKLILILFLSLFFIGFVSAEECPWWNPLGWWVECGDESPNWISPPNSVGDNQAYILHNITNGYLIENFYGTSYFYNWYNIVVDHKTNNTLIEDERWIVEYKNKQGNWRILDLYDKSLEINDSNENELIVRRISTDGISTLIEEYKFSKGVPKITLNFTGEDEIYRLVWKSTGIAGTKLKNKENDLNSDFSFNDSNHITFTDDFVDRFLISFNWNDVFNQTDNSTSFIQVDWSASSKKLDVYFGEFNNSFYVDPTWTTPSSVVDCSSQGTINNNCVDSIDDDITGGLDDYWAEQDNFGNIGDMGKDPDGYEWGIIYDMGSTECIHSIRIWADGNYFQQPPCKVSIIKICDDDACSGEDNLITSDCLFSTSEEWQECVLDADAEGQYIYVAGGIYSVGSCQDIIASDFIDMNLFEEFDADIDGTCAPPEPSISIGSEGRNVTFVNPNSDVKLFSLATAVLSNVSATIVSENSTGSWVNHTTDCGGDVTTCWGNYTIPSSELSDGEIVGYYFWANNTVSNVTNTSTYSFTVANYREFKVITSGGYSGEIIRQNSDRAGALEGEIITYADTDAIGVGQRRYEQTYQIHRGFASFDTISMPDDITITSVKIYYMFKFVALQQNNFNFDVYTNISEGNMFGIIGSEDWDYYAEKLWTIEEITGVESTDVWYNSDMPSGNFSFINKTGRTQFALMSSEDVNDIEITGNNIDRIFVYTNTVDKEMYLAINWTSVEEDETSPTYSNNQTNTTTAGASTLFSIQYNDDIALHPLGQYIFSTNNTGVWTNESAVNFTATPSWANVTKTLNSTEGIAIGYRWFADDNEGNINNTEIFTLTTTSADTCTCPGAGNNWEVDLSDFCILSEACDLTTGKISFTGSGNFTCNARLDTTDLGDVSSGNYFWVNSNCEVYVDG